MKNVRRGLNHEVLVKQLTERAHSKTQRSLFPTMRDLLCFAAALGFAENRRTPLIGKTADIDGRIFENSDQATDLVYLVALAGTGDITILQADREDAAVAVFEEYANGGLALLQEWLIATPGDIDGDAALLNGLTSHGFVGLTPPSTGTAIADVQF
jgi:dnd system-associated protein 4